MQIKFKELVENSGAKRNGEVWRAVRVSGSKIQDGSEWLSGNIFVQESNDDLIKDLRQLQPGDRVDVKHKKVNGNWTISGVEAITNQPAPTGGGSAYSGKKAGGGWVPDPNKNRGVVLSYAIKDVLPQLHSKETLEVMEYDDYVNRAVIIADMLLKYVEGNMAPTPLDEGDPLDPP